MAAVSRLKIYVEDEYGGMLVPLSVKLTGRQLMFEVTRDTQRKSEGAPQNILSAIMDMLDSAQISYSTDASEHMPPHRLSIPVRSK